MTLFCRIRTNSNWLSWWSRHSDFRGGGWSVTPMCRGACRIECRCLKHWSLSIAPTRPPLVISMLRHHWLAVGHIFPTLYCKFLHWNCPASSFTFNWVEVSIRLWVSSSRPGSALSSASSHAAIRILMRRSTHEPSVIRINGSSNRVMYSVSRSSRLVISWLFGGTFRL